MEHVDHILVVDDDREIRQMVADYLKKNGLRVSMVGDGREMHAVLDTTAIDRARAGSFAHSARAWPAIPPGPAPAPGPPAVALDEDEGEGVSLIVRYTCVLISSR